MVSIEDYKIEIVKLKNDDDKKIFTQKYFFLTVFLLYFRIEKMNIFTLEKELRTNLTLVFMKL